MRGFHAFSMGVHWIQMNNALSPIATFIETMMHHTLTHIQPCDMRSRVMAKDVLLHTAARMEKVPPILAKRGSFTTKFSKEMS
jgi:hypothetical protein